MAKSTSTSESNLEKKFLGVTNTQDSIQSLSLWIIHHKAHAKKIVDVWMKVLKKGKINHRLTLFYLANDVIQNSKRKGAGVLVDAFQGVLPEAALLLRDDKIKGSVERVLSIWENRSIYTSELISELKGILNHAKSQNSAITKMVANFKYENTIDKIRQMVKLQNDCSLKLVALNSGKFDPADSGILQQFKDRKHGQQFTVDFEEATRCLEAYIEALEKEVQERAEFIQVLEHTDIYYETQRGEARIVCNAYKNFGNRVTAQKKRIAELIASLPSPFPSPCADAPSPTNSEEGPDFEAVKPEAELSPKAESVPSPEGTPEDLRLSPVGDQGMPIASFMQAGGIMSSWMEAFQSGSPASTEAKGQTTSSLDNRLMNLMNKMPQPAQQIFLEQKGDDTPVKDESSGQGTPVQDEDSNKVVGKAITTIPSPKQNNKNHQNQQPNFNSTNSNSSNSAEKDSRESNNWGNRKNEMISSPKNIENLVEPLQPPPKPNFGNFGELLEPTFNNNNIIVINPGKPKQDPRLSKAVRPNTEPVPGDDDTELMDMEIEDSEEEVNIHRGSRDREVTLKEVPVEGSIVETVNNQQQSIPVLTEAFMEPPTFLAPMPFDRGEFKRGRVRVARPPARGGVEARVGQKSFKDPSEVMSEWDAYGSSRNQAAFPMRGRGNVHPAGGRGGYQPGFENDFNQNFREPEFPHEQDFSTDSEFAVEREFPVDRAFPNESEFAMEFQGGRGGYRAGFTPNRNFMDYPNDPGFNGSPYHDPSFTEGPFRSQPRFFRPPQPGKRFMPRKPFNRGRFNPPF